jgi:dTDP-4-dehydrorhamnose 3,5-epimerase
MDQMKFIRTEIPEIVIIETEMFEDERGFFMETYRRSLMDEHEIHADFLQDNHSGSRRGVLRGLHYQIQQPQGKLVRAVRGEVFDVAVDLREGSPTFGAWVGVNLSAENRRQLWIPEGFAHGFYTLSDWAELIYKATDYYAPEWDRTLLWDDPEVGIAWPLIDKEPPLLSEKDRAGTRLSEAELFSFAPGG